MTTKELTGMIKACDIPFDKLHKLINEHVREVLIEFYKYITPDEFFDEEIESNVDYFLKDYAKKF